MCPRRGSSTTSSPGSGAHAPSKLVFLDATTGVALFGLLTRNLRGKQALAIPIAGAALLVNIRDEGPSRILSVWREFDAKLSDAEVLEAKVRVPLSSRQNVHPFFIRRLRQASGVHRSNRFFSDSTA
jgi:hypothetical protein